MSHSFMVPPPPPEREVLVLQGLQNLDIQEDQNAVFVCELSVEDVLGEWFRNGDRIQPTSTIKIRHEGTQRELAAYCHTQFSKWLVTANHTWW